ncbi:MAG TPA: hypothetical protein VM164_02405 [Burkholderiales bacterium]|nr:hypothetical protein [Burkholderiales bacterium]
MSSEAVACPHCGAPHNLWIARLKAVSRGATWQVLGAITLIGAIVAFAAGARDIGTVLVVFGFVAFVVGRLL